MTLPEHGATTEDTEPDREDRLGVCPVCYCVHSERLGCDLEGDE